VLVGTVVTFASGSIVSAVWGGGAKPAESGGLPAKGLSG
jgi:hypothetical protein